MKEGETGPKSSQSEDLQVRK